MCSALKTLSVAGLALALFAVGPATADRANSQSHFYGRSTTTLFGPDGPQQPQFPSAPNNNSYNAGGFFDYFFGNLQSRHNPDLNIDPQVDSGPETQVYTYFADPLVALGSATAWSRANVEIGYEVGCFESIPGRGPGSGYQTVADR